MPSTKVEPNCAPWLKVIMPWAVGAVGVEEARVGGESGSRSCARVAWSAPVAAVRRGWRGHLGGMVGAVGMARLTFCGGWAGFARAGEQGGSGRCPGAIGREWPCWGGVAVAARGRRGADERAARTGGGSGAARFLYALAAQTGGDGAEEGVVLLGCHGGGVGGLCGYVLRTGDAGLFRLEPGCFGLFRHLSI